MNWFRLPVHIVTADPDVRSAWVWLLGSWHIGAKPGINDLRRETSWGAGRATKFMAEARQWAEANGGVVHPMTHRNSSGTEAEQQRNKTGTLEGTEKANNGISSEQNRNSSGTLPEQQRNASHARVSSEMREIKELRESEQVVLPVPVNTAASQVQLQEPPCLASPQAIPTSAQVSTAKEATNMQPGLFGAATVGTVESQKTSKKAAAIQQVWEAFRLYKPRCGEQPGEGDGELITKFLAKYKPEDLISVIRWAWQCDETEGDHLWLQGRSGRGTQKFLEVSNLLVKVKFDGRLRYARDWEADPARRIRTVEEARNGGTKGPASEKPAQAAPQEDPSAIWDSIIKRRSTGIRIMPNDIPPRVQGAIRAAGGWNQLGLLDNFTERQARTAFITEYKRTS